MHSTRFQAVTKVILLGLVFALTFMIGHTARAQERYSESPQAKHRTTKEGSLYKMHLEFIDARNKPRAVDVSYPAGLTDEMIRRYGVPPSMYEPYDPSRTRARAVTAKAGLYKEDDTSLGPSYSAIVSYYAKVFGKPIADELKKMLKADGHDSPRDRVELAQSFVQAIPYGIPSDMDDGKKTGELAPVPKVLRDMYGDCDSKAMLFASILVYLIDPDDVLFVSVPEHMLVAVSVDGQGGDTSIELDGKEYVVAETAGPGLRLGEPGDEFESTDEKTLQVEKLSFDEAYKEKLDHDKAMHVVNAAPKKAFDITFKNECSNTIQLAIQLVQLDGELTTKGWYWLSPGDTSHIEYTGSSTLYFYATGRDGVWEGDHDTAFRGAIYRFKKISIEGLPPGKVTQSLSCH